MTGTNDRTRNNYTDALTLISQLHGEEMFEIFTAYEPEKKNSKPHLFPSSAEQIETDTLQAENQAMRGVWFTANSMNKGKRQKAMISRFNAVSIEKDFSGPREKIEKGKQAYLPEILNLQLKPSIIIETKRGYQLHWLLEEGTITEADQCEALQRAIQEKLDGDPAAVGAERLWRLPGYYHWKDPNHPFMCRLTEADYSKRYSFDELVHKFGGKKKVAAIKKKRALNQYSGKPIQLEDFKGTGEIDDIFRGCHVFANLQTKKDPSHLERLALGMTLIHLGSEGVDHFRGIARKWNDYDEDVTESNIDYIVRKGYQAPTCAWLIKKGVCPGRCTNIRGYRKPLDLFYHPVKLLPAPFKARKLVSDATVQILPYHMAITDKIVNVLQGRGQTVATNHRDALMSITKIMSLQLSNNRPIVIPAVPGLGKTTLIIHYLTQRADNDPEFGAVVVVERQDTIDYIANMLYRSGKRGGLFGYIIDEKRAYALKGYSPEYCLKGYPRYKPSQCKTCDVTIMDCRVKYNFIEQKDYPIVVISQSRLFQMSDKDDLLKNLSEWRSNGKKHKRQLLLIDERPKLVENIATNSTMWDTLLADVQQYVPECFTEVSKGVNMIRGSYSLPAEYEYVQPRDSKFVWSTAFAELWESNYLGDYPEYPDLVASIIREGGLYCKQDKTVTTKHYSNIYWQDYSTFIYDGTASIDLDYRDTSFYFLDLPGLREYSNLTLNICMEASLTKTFYTKHPEFVERFCEDIKSIAQSGNTYVACYKSYEDEFAEHLKNEENISIEHYGNTRGANHLISNTNIVCTGILNKGESYYLSKSMAINEIAPDYEVITKDKVRRFKDDHAESVKVYEMVTELVQEIFRTQLRDHSSEAEVNVYLCTRDINLVKALQDYFTGCKVNREWHPMALYSDRSEFQEFVSEHEDEYKTKTKLVKAFLDNGYSLQASDIIEVLEVDPSNAARYLR